MVPFSCLFLSLLLELTISHVLSIRLRKLTIVQYICKKRYLKSIYIMTGISEAQMLLKNLQLLPDHPVHT